VSCYFEEDKIWLGVINCCCCSRVVPFVMIRSFWVCDVGCFGFILWKSKDDIKLIFMLI
jgi:hypothetical protein